MPKAAGIRISASGSKYRGPAKPGETREWKAGKFKKLTGGKWVEVTKKGKPAAEQKPKPDKSVQKVAKDARKAADKPKAPASTPKAAAPATGPAKGAVGAIRRTPPADPELRRKQETIASQIIRDRKAQLRERADRKARTDRTGHPTQNDLAREDQTGFLLIQNKKSAVDQFGNPEFIRVKMGRNATQGMNWLNPEKRIAIYGRDGYRCVYCGLGVKKLRSKGIPLSADHVNPNKSGGGNHESNIVTCCSRCNSARSNRTIREFAGWMWHEHHKDFDTISRAVRNATSRKLSFVDENGGAVPMYKGVMPMNKKGKPSYTKSRMQSKELITRMRVLLTATALAHGVIVQGSRKGETKASIAEKHGMEAPKVNTRKKPEGPVKTEVLVRNKEFAGKKTRTPEEKAAAKRKAAAKKKLKASNARRRDATMDEVT